MDELYANVKAKKHGKRILLKIVLTVLVLMFVMGMVYSACYSGSNATTFNHHLWHNVFLVCYCYTAILTTVTLFGGVICGLIALIYQIWKW